MNRVTGVSAVAIMVALLLTGGEAAAEGGKGGTLQLLDWQPPTMLNPQLSSGRKDRTAARIVYEPLASFDADGEMVPFLAAEIPSRENGGVAADGRSVTWKLKQGVKWADGEPFTADDVVFTYAYATNPAVGATTRDMYESVERVEAIDDHTVKIVFKNVNPAWVLPFVGPQGMIIPRHVFEPYNGANARDAPANRLAIGTGAFRVAAVEQHDLLLVGDEIVDAIKIVYEANPYYREPDKPYFERIELRGGGDSQIAAAAVFEYGAVDFARNLQVDIETLDAFEALGRATLVVVPAASPEQIMINFTDPNRETADGERSSVAFPHPILADRRVRQALSLAIDREAIAALYGRTGSAARNVLVSPKPYASTNTSWSFDPEQAAALLEEAGWMDSDGDGVRDKDGSKLHLVFQTSLNEVRQLTQQMAKASLGSIGVEIDAKIIDPTVFFGPVTRDTNTTRHFYADLQMFTRNNDNPDPDDFMGEWVCAEAAQMANNWSGPNRSRYCNPAYDALYEQSRTELDPDRRRALFIAMNDLLIEDAAVIPLVERRTTFGLSNEIELGREPTPWDVDTWDIAEWRRKTGGDATRASSAADDASR